MPASGRDFVLIGDYTYNNSLRGQVAAKVVNGQVECLEFHDFVGRCRPPNHPTPLDIAARVAADMLMSGGGGSGGHGGGYADGSTSGADQMELNGRNVYQPPPPPPPSPVPPINDFCGSEHGSALGW